MTRETEPQILLAAADVEEALGRLSEAIVAGGATSDLLLVGIRRRGVELAERLAILVGDKTGSEIPTGSLDITLYRDDFGQIGALPLIGTTEIPTDITDRRIVIVDDVLYTGRTIRAALNELADFGRPGRIELCVLVDRGGRELPIQADYIGVSQQVADGDHIEVRVPEEDGELCVRVVGAGKTAAE